MADRDKRRNKTAEALAEEVGFLDLEVLRRPTTSSACCSTLNGTIDVGRPSMPLEVGGNHLPTSCQSGKLCHARETENGRDVNQRIARARARALDLVIHLETVHGSVALLRIVDSRQSV
jgi:hypothetical protein